MYCTNCGNYIEQNSSFCPRCGKNIVMGNQNINDNLATQSNVINDNVSLEEKMISSYVGVNYEKIKNQKFSVPAFFLSWLYMGYRKFYKLLLIYVIPITILSIILIEDLLTLIYIPFAILAGIKFNKWYLDDVKKQINKIKMSNPQVSESELISICSKKGGTSIVPIILTFIGIGIIGAIIRVSLTIILGTI